MFVLRYFNRPNLDKNHRTGRLGNPPTGEVICILAHGLLFEQLWSSPVFCKLISESAFISAPANTRRLGGSANSHRQAAVRD